MTNATRSFVGITGDGDNAGGDASAVLGGANNQACAEWSGIGAGLGNGVAEIASFIAGGEDNNVSGRSAFIAGTNNSTVTGDFSMIGTSADSSITGSGSFIGAGDDIFFQTATSSDIGSQISGTDSFIGAGDQNNIAANQSFVGAGQSNVVASPAADSVVAGGNNNYTSAVYAAIGGGSGNKAEGAFATIPGGADDEALGAASFAAGYHAEAAHAGSFVWSDDVSGSSLVADAAANSFVVRASGGTTIYSSEKLTSGVKLAAGSGTWASLSDRNAKTDIVALDDASILAKVSSLPIDGWRYKTEAGVRHLGPMAQDFYAAFGVGEDDRHSTSIDEDGVALAAIKALHGENRALIERNESMHRDIAHLQSNVARLASNFAALEVKNAELERRLDRLAAAR